MAIEKKLICFARLAEFERQLAAGNILEYSIVFIQDAKMIWNRGTYYDCSGSSDAALYGDGYINSEVRDDGTYLKTNVADNLGAVSARGQLADALDVKTFVADAIPSNVSELNNDSSYTPYDQVVSMLSSYVKKETGKGLSTQDFTTELEGKLKGIEANAQKNVQSDWNENDRGSDAYVNNRTHYSYDIEQVTSFSIASKNEGDILVTGLQDGVFYRIINDAGGKNEAFHFVEGHKVVIPSNGPTIEAVCAYEDDYCLKLTTPTYGMTESFVLREVYVEQLDDVYIPETIARKAEIATINGQSLTEGGDITIEGGSLTESDIAAMGFTKNTGTYSKPSGGIPKSDLTSAVQTSLGKADTALQSYTEQYKGTVTGVKINGTTKSPSNGVVDLGTVITDVSNLATKDEVILKDVTGELVTVQTQALYGGGSVYALPDTANGDEDDVLLSRGSVKTVNGQSILGSGNISISGGSSGGSGADNWALLDPNVSYHVLEPNTKYVLHAIPSMSYSFDFNLATVSEIRNGLVQEFSVRIHTGSDISGNNTITFLKYNEAWANNILPEIPDIGAIEFSLVPCANLNNTIYLLGTWAAFNVPLSGSPSLGPA